MAEVDPRLTHWGYAEDDWEEVPVIDPNADPQSPEGNVVRYEWRPKAGAEKKPQGVMYERLVPHLVALVNRQRHALEALTARVAVLERG